MPCCKIKVDRQHDKVQCIVCNEFMHAACYNINKQEIKLIKDTFKCEACMKARRASLADTQVLVTLPSYSNDKNVVGDIECESLSSLDSQSNGTAIVLDGDKGNSVASGDSTFSLNAGTDDEAPMSNLDLVNNDMVAGATEDRLSLNLLLGELRSIKTSNELLNCQVTALVEANKSLLSKVDNLELLVRSKHCLCTAKGNVFAPKSNLSVNNKKLFSNVVANRAADNRAVAKPVYDVPLLIDLTNTTNCAESTKSAELSSVVVSKTESNSNAELSFVDKNDMIDANIQSSSSSHVVAKSVNPIINTWSLIGKKKKSKRELIGTDYINTVGSVI